MLSGLTGVLASDLPWKSASPKSSRDGASREMEDGIMLLENLLQPTHLVLVLAIALLVFGPKNLPEIGAGLGRAIREFKESVNSNER